MNDERPPRHSHHRRRRRPEKDKGDDEPPQRPTTSVNDRDDERPALSNTVGDGSSNKSDDMLANLRSLAHDLNLTASTAGDDDDAGDGDDQYLTPPSEWGSSSANDAPGGEGGGSGRLGIATAGTGRVLGATRRTQSSLGSYSRGDSSNFRSLDTTLASDPSWTSSRPSSAMSSVISSGGGVSTSGISDSLPTTLDEEEEGVDRHVEVLMDGSSEEVQLAEILDELRNLSSSTSATSDVAPHTSMTAADDSAKQRRQTAARHHRQPAVVPKGSSEEYDEAPRLQASSAAAAGAQSRFSSDPGTSSDPPNGADIQGLRHDLELADGAFRLLNRIHSRDGSREEIEAEHGDDEGGVDDNGGYDYDVLLHRRASGHGCGDGREKDDAGRDTLDGDDNEGYDYDAPLDQHADRIPVSISIETNNEEEDEEQWQVDDALRRAEALLGSAAAAENGDEGGGSSSLDSGSECNIDVVGRETIVSGRGTGAGRARAISPLEGEDNAISPLEGDDMEIERQEGRLQQQGRQKGARGEGNSNNTAPTKLRLEPTRDDVARAKGKMASFHTDSSVAESSLSASDHRAMERAETAAGAKKKTSPTGSRASKASSSKTSSSSHRDRCRAAAAAAARRQKTAAATDATRNARGGSAKGVTTTEAAIVSKRDDDDNRRARQEKGERRDSDLLLGWSGGSSKNNLLVGFGGQSEHGSNDDLEDPREYVRDDVADLHKSTSGDFIVDFASVTSDDAKRLRRQRERRRSFAGGGSCGAVEAEPSEGGKSDDGDEGGENMDRRRRSDAIAAAAAPGAIAGTSSSAAAASSGDGAGDGGRGNGREAAMRRTLSASGIARRGSEGKVEDHPWRRRRSDEDDSRSSQNRNRGQGLTLAGIAAASALPEDGTEDDSDGGFGVDREGAAASDRDERDAVDAQRRSAAAATATGAAAASVVESDRSSPAPRSTEDGRASPALALPAAASVPPKEEEGASGDDNRGSDGDGDGNGNGDEDEDENDRSTGGTAAAATAAAAMAAIERATLSAAKGDDDACNDNDDGRMTPVANSVSQSVPSSHHHDSATSSLSVHRPVPGEEWSTSIGTASCASEEYGTAEDGNHDLMANSKSRLEEDVSRQVKEEAVRTLNLASSRTSSPDFEPERDLEEGGGSGGGDNLNKDLVLDRVPSLSTTQRSDFYGAGEMESASFEGNCAGSDVDESGDHDAGEKRSGGFLQFVPTVFGHKERDGTPPQPLSPRRRRTLKWVYVAGWLVVVALIAASIGVAVKSRSGGGGDKSVDGGTDPLPDADLAPSAAPSAPPTSDIPRGPDTLAPFPQPSPQPNAVPSMTASPTELVTNLTISLLEFEAARQASISALVISISGEDAIGDNSTAQYAAYQWIMLSDPLRLLSTDDTFVQRYAAATFYFSTDSSSSWVECGAAEGGSPCSAGEEARYLSGFSECGWFGIACQGSNIRSISLKENGLRGSLPLEISAISSLTTLHLSRNELTSTIPPEFGSMPSLLNLLINNNALVGTIPSEIGSMPNLRFLAVGNNELTGTLPRELFVPSLRHLDLGHNHFNSTIPAELYTVSTNLINVDLGSNRLSGEIPSGLGSLSGLKLLTMGNNLFHGPLPGELFAPPLLDTLDVSYNVGMSGPIPEELYSATSLTFLNLGSIGLTGSLSDRIGDLVHMEKLVIWFNDLSGTIPSSVGNMKALDTFHTAYNNFNGSMPSTVCDLRTAANLEVLSADCSGDPPQVECSCCSLCLPED